MSLPRALGLIAMLYLVAAPSAGAQLPVGESEGVRIVRERGAIVFKFTPRADKLRRRLAGRLVNVFCTNLPREGSNVTSGGDTLVRAPKRGRKLRTGEASRGLDYCELSLRPQRAPLVAVPLTQAGAVYLDEREKAVTLSVVLAVANLVVSEKNLEGYPTHPQLIDFLTGSRPAPAANRFVRRIVALTTPADTPPAGQVGYYSDGGERVAVVMLSRSSRRLFIEFEPDDVLRTNVAGFIFGGGEL